MKKDLEAAAPVDLNGFTRIVAIVIGIQTYCNAGGDSLPEVSFARADAEDFAATIRQIYGDVEVDLDLRLDGNATLTGLKEALRYKIKTLSEHDLFVFYYAGHGFHGEGGNRLTAWDTSTRNIAGTTLLLQQDVLEPLRQRKHPRSLVFVDACAAGFRDVSGARDVISDLDVDEVREFLDAGWYCAVFLSCSPGEKSYPSNRLGHGIWTDFLLRALRGEAKEALTRDRWLTDSGLRDWLRREVPQFITRERSDADIQTPQAIISASGSFRIRHVAPPKIDVSTALATVGLRNRDEYLEGVEEGSISRLKGFDKKRGHTVPSGISEAADRWVSKLLADEVADELQELQNRAKKELGIRLQDMRLAVADGQGSLDSKIFRYSIDTMQNPEKPSEYLIVRRLRLRSGWAAYREPLSAVLPDDFGLFVVEFDGAVVEYDALLVMLENIADATAAEIDADVKRHRVIYASSDGTKFVFDLDRERLEISIGKRGSLEIIDAASKYQLGLSGERSATLALPSR